MSEINQEKAEIDFNNYTKYNLFLPAEKLSSFSIHLIERNKIVNEDLQRLVNLQKELKLKEINNSNKKVELLILERRIKDKNTKKLNLKNILECYSIILKNNEELLNRRVEQLKERDLNLQKKEFLLSKIKTTLKNDKINDYNNADINYLINDLNEANIFEEIQKQFKIFHTLKIRNFSNKDLNENRIKKFEIFKNEELFIQKNDQNNVQINKICQGVNKSNKINKTENNIILKNCFERITEENEDIILSRKTSLEKKIKMQTKKKCSISYQVENKKDSNNTIRNTSLNIRKKEKSKDTDKDLSQENNDNILNNSDKKFKNSKSNSSTISTAKESRQSFNQEINENSKEEDNNLEKKYEIKKSNKEDLKERNQKKNNYIVQEDKGTKNENIIPINLENLNDQTKAKPQNNLYKKVKAEKEDELKLSNELKTSNDDSKIKTIHNIIKKISNNTETSVDKKPNSRLKSNKSVIKLKSSFDKKRNEEDNKYSGLARNLTNNKSFDRFKVSKNDVPLKKLNNTEILDRNDGSESIGKFNANEKNEKEDKEKNIIKKQILVSNKEIPKNPEINQDILNKLLKEADEDTMKKKGILPIQKNEKQIVEKNNSNQIKLSLFDINDKNLIKISNVLGYSRRNSNDEKNNQDENNAKQEIQNKSRDNSFAEGILLLNQNGIFKKKNNTLKIQSGLNLVLEDEEKEKNLKIIKKKEIIREDYKILKKDILIVKDNERDEENQKLNIKAKRNTVSLGMDIDKKLNISNFNEKKKDSKKNLILNNNANNNSFVDNKNHKAIDSNANKFQNPPRKSNQIRQIYENSRRSLKNCEENSTNSVMNDIKNPPVIKENRKSAANNKLTNLEKLKEDHFTSKNQDIKENKKMIIIQKNKSDWKGDSKEISQDDKFKKKLDFQNLNNKKFLFNEKDTQLSIIQKDVNILLESRLVNVDSEIEKENEMKVIIENEQILKDEIYIQKITKYEDELLTKNSIKFVNDINLDDLKIYDNIRNKVEIKSNIEEISNDTESVNESSKKKKNEEKKSNLLSIQKEDETYENFNQIIRHESNISDLNLNMYLNKNNCLNEIENDKEILIEYENDLSKSFNQSIISKDNSNNSPNPIGLIRNSLLDKNPSPLNILKKNSFDSKYESSKITEYDSSPTRTRMKRLHPSKGVVENTNTSRYTAGMIELKKITKIININDANLTDSLDSSNIKKDYKKIRNSMDSRPGAYENKNKDTLILKNDSKSVSKIKNDKVNNKKQQKLRGLEKDKQNIDNISQKNVEIKKNSVSQENSINIKSLRVNDKLENESKEIDNPNKNNIEKKIISNNLNQSFENYNIEKVYEEISDENLPEKNDRFLIKTKNQRISNEVNLKKTTENITTSKISKVDNQNILSFNVVNYNITTTRDSLENNNSIKKNEKYVLKNDSNNTSEVNGKEYTTLDDDEDDDKKIIDYQEYIRKMKQMAAETKVIEDNMRQFANIVQNIVENNNYSK